MYAVPRFNHQVSPASQPAHGFKPDGHFIFRFGSSAAARQAKGNRKTKAGHYCVLLHAELNEVRLTSTLGTKAAERH